ncbi:d316de0b-e674-447d-8bce-7a5d8d82e475 [Sclerotinia trifoliorum]|uniref:Mediator of RNA polymerase II transcription subunit 17 n=1 Tax=Sclerotinia trifoliorum TaxID=28548 RepID=A0A8H2ZNX8_9HELO|nr:d316de0b-e674-447d-8bce-7a5d8d82e475 [Sclerotinia trifoliorum]
MTSLPHGIPISLRPAPTPANSSIPLPLLIARINAERGGFRNLSEDSLRQEIAEAELGEDDEENESSSEDGEAEEEPDRMKELLTARDEILGQLEHAHNAAMISLDFISLLLSKDAPVQASLSISPSLRELAGMGTLGTDKTAESRVTEEQKKENKKIAKGWKASNLSKTVDAILASATRLEKEIDAETKYWEEVLAVSESGWAVCRLPQEKHTLGVRFGFAEASPTFRNRSLGALRRNPNGSIYLDQGITSPEPQSLRVLIETNGVTTGETILPKAVPQGAPIQDLILQARNTIFASELWQEMIREVRTLASHGLQSDFKTNRITFPLSPTKKILIELQTLPTDPFRPVLGSRPDSYLANGIYLTLHLLLSLSHRRHYRIRTNPPPPISGQPRPNNPFPILRSLLTRFAHETVISSLHSLLTPLCTTLTSACLSTPPTYTITPGTSSPFQNLSTPERILTTLTNQLEFLTTITFPFPLSSPPHSSIPSSFSHTTPLTPVPSILQIRTLTITQNYSRPVYYLRITPDNSPLLQICPPPPAVAEWDYAKDYILWAVGCWLAHIFSSPSPKEDEEGWKVTTQANILRKIFSGPNDEGGVKQMSFEVSSIPILGPEEPSKVGEKGEEKIKISVKWEWTTGIDQEWKERRDLKQGEGAYDWYSGVGGIGRGELEEVVRKIGDVVEEAGRGKV